MGLVGQIGSMSVLTSDQSGTGGLFSTHFKQIMLNLPDPPRGGPWSESHSQVLYNQVRVDVTRGLCFNPAA